MTTTNDASAADHSRGAKEQIAIEANGLYSTRGRRATGDDALDIAERLLDEFDADYLGIERPLVLIRFALELTRRGVPQDRVPDLTMYGNEVLCRSPLAEADAHALAVEGAKLLNRRTENV